MNQLKQALTLRSIPVLAVIVAAIYLFLGSVHLFKSESSFTVRSSESVRNMGVDAIGILTGAGDNNRQMVLTVANYLSSKEYLEKLDQEVGIKDDYQGNYLDPFYLVTEGSTLDEFHREYKQNLKVVYDEMSGLGTIEFFSSDPTLSQAVVTHMLNAGEELLNNINEQVAADEKEFVADWVKSAEQHFQKSIAELKAFQDKEDTIDPASQAGMVGELITGLESELAAKRAKLAEMASFMKETSFPVKEIKAQISALEKQVANQRSRLVGTGNSQAMNEVIAAYEEVKAKLEIAAETYRAALAASEKANIEYAKKSKRLITVSGPSLPDDPSKPNKAYVLFATLIFAFCLSKLAMFAQSIINDHKD